MAPTRSSCARRNTGWEKSGANGIRSAIMSGGRVSMGRPFLTENRRLNVYPVSLLPIPDGQSLAEERVPIDEHQSCPVPLLRPPARPGRFKQRGHLGPDADAARCRLALPSRSGERAGQRWLVPLVLAP